jgi:hypothetical protein
VIECAKFFNVSQKMSRVRNIHVVPRTDGWIIRKEGSGRPTSLHPTQRDAIEEARELARDQRTELIIHGRNGRIRDRDSYGSDSAPPRDRVVLFPTTSASTSEKAIEEAVNAVVRVARTNGKGSSRSSSKR